MGRGQGLWNCFLEDSKTSWEVILNNRGDRDGQMNQVHVDCCRRIVQLCKDCLLIVYQFANESKRTTTTISYDNSSSSSNNLHRLHRTSPTNNNRSTGVRKSSMPTTSRSKYSTV